MENQIVKNVYSVLTEIQNELKAPKNQWNAFGKYKYRSCEDIQEALKPLLKKYSCTLFLTDTIISVENRFYVGAKAVFIYNPTGEKIETSGFAREEENKKGMDQCQVTGASSSYARKYSLNSLFLIDDTKDSDSTNQGAEVKSNEVKASSVLIKLNQDQINVILRDNKEAVVLKNNKIRYDLSIDQIKTLADSMKKKQEEVNTESNELKKYNDTIAPELDLNITESK